MTTTSPSLLTLPRELRDHIYSYLTQNLNFCVFYDIDNLSEVRSEKAFTIHIENAPIAGVLLSHPRLHNEYLENPIFKTLTAAVYIDPTCGIHNERPAPQLPELTARQAESILRKVQHAIIIIDFSEANVGITSPTSRHTGFFSGSSHSKSALLCWASKSLHPSGRMPISLLSSHTRTDFYHNTLFQRPSADLVCLPLIQRLEAERLASVLRNGRLSYDVGLTYC